MITQGGELIALTTSVSTDHGDMTTHMSAPQARTILEAASILRLSRSSLYELIRTGQLASFRAGGCRRITDTAIAAFIARQESEEAQ